MSQIIEELLYENRKAMTVALPLEVVEEIRKPMSC